MCNITLTLGTHADFHQPSANLTKYQAVVYNLDVNVFNMLPSYIKRV